LLFVDTCAWRRFFKTECMAKTKQQKELELQALHDKFERSRGAVFASFAGLTVNDAQELREKLREENAEMVVAKKSLMGIMFEKSGLTKDQVLDMEGSVGVVFGYGDEIAPAKIVAEFAKAHDVVSFRGGVLDGEFIGVEKVIALSVLPSKQELLAKMVGSLKSPISGFVNVLGGNMRGLVQVLNQIKEQKTS